MPGKISRKPYRPTLGDIIGEAPRGAPHEGPRTTEEENAFLRAVVRGLLRRLKHDRQYEAIKEGIRFASKEFGTWVDERGTDWAEQIVLAVVMSFTQGLINKTAKKPQPLQLLSEWTEAKKSMDKLKGESDLRGWLKEHTKLSESQINDLVTYWNPKQGVRSDLIEDFLAKQHNISQSAVHKSLADAGRILKTRNPPMPRSEP